MAIVFGGVRYDEKSTGVARLKRKAKKKKSKKKGRRK